MRKEPKSARRHGRYDDDSLEEVLMATQEPDWDYSYTSPTSMERDPSTIEPAWEDNSIVASQEQPPARTPPRITGPLSHMQSFCASRDCAIKQEPESLYYQTIAMDRPMKRPDPSSPRQTPAQRQELKTRMEQQTRKDTNHVRRAMKQNLVHSATKPKKPQHAPYRCKPIEYGKTTQMADLPSTSP